MAAPLSQIITGIEEKQKHPPSDFALSQNYPNPFNPSTNISFSMSSRSKVSLKIYDVIGREVTALINGELSAGRHTLRWDASGFQVVFISIDFKRVLSQKRGNLF